MALIRWEPAREVSTLQSEMNRLFNTFFDTPTAGAGAPQRWVPAMDLRETDGHYVVSVDLPGVSPDDVKVELDENVLTIAGERRAGHDDRGNGYVRVERAYGTFSRLLTLPEGVDPAGIEASFDSGVLEVRVPKPAVREPHRVSIAVGGDAVDGTASEPSGDAAA